MKFRKEKKELVSVNLTPLIDVVFLLLIFFMVSTTFTKETQLRVDLPEASAEAATAEVKNVTLLINRNGAYALDGTMLSASDSKTLEEGLRKAADGNFEQSLIIVADANTTHQSVATAMDVAGRLGFVNLRIATQEPSDE